MSDQELATTYRRQDQLPDGRLKVMFADSTTEHVTLDRVVGVPIYDERGKLHRGSLLPSPDGYKTRNNVLLGIRAEVGGLTVDAAYSPGVVRTGGYEWSGDVYVNRKSVDIVIDYAIVFAWLKELGKGVGKKLRFVRD